MSDWREFWASGLLLLPGVHQMRTQDDISLFLVLLVELQILKYKYKFVVNGGQGFEKFIL